MKYCKDCEYCTDDNTNKFCPKCGKPLCRLNPKAEKKIFYNYLKKIIDGTNAQIKRHSTNDVLGYVCSNDSNDNLQIINNIISDSNRPRYVDYHIHVYNYRYKPKARLVIRTTGIIEGYYRDCFDTELTPELLQNLVDNDVDISSIISPINKAVDDFSTEIENFTKNLPLWKDLQNIIRKGKGE